MFFPLLQPVTIGDGIDIERGRIQRRLRHSLKAPVTLLLGPAGCGKSVALRACPGLNAARYYAVGTFGSTLISFVRGMARAIADVRPGAQTSFASAWERSLQAREPEAALAHWMCEHLADLDAPMVFDDLHDATEDPSIASFLTKFAELRAPRAIVVAARVAGRLPVADWIATGMMQPPIDAFDLRFDREDVVQLSAFLGCPVVRAQAQTIVERTNGLAVAVRYALSRRAQTGATAFELLTSSDDIAATIFARRSSEERDYLFACSLLPVVLSDVLVSMGWSDSRHLRRAAGRDAAFIWDTDAAPPGQLRDSFRRYLATQLRICDEDHRVALALRAVRALESKGRFADALTVATQQHLAQALARLIDTYGLAILESGQLDVITASLADVDPAAGGVAAALLGSLEAGRGRLDTGEAWFALGLETAEHPLSRVTIALHYARELMQRRRPDAYTILEPYADAAADELPAELGLDVRSSYAQALLIAGRVAEAARRTDLAVALLGPDVSPSTHARVLVRAAYVALESGAVETARERAAAAAPLAIAQGLYDAATSAYSVLYNIAYDYDDDASAGMRYLRLLRAQGAKAGTLRSDFYATIALYELHAEAGDQAELDALEREMAGFDISYATPEVTEGLLPAKALQAGWAGEFARAQDMLAPTAEQQASVERTALRWAEIALYAAAAGDISAAGTATQGALDAIGGDAESPVRRATALLLLSLAHCVKGDTARAAAFLSRASGSAPNAPRITALHGAIACIIANAADSTALRTALPAELAQLKAVSYGGFARLIEALPWTGGSLGSTLGALIASGRRPSRSSGRASRGMSVPVRRSDVVAGSSLRLPFSVVDAQIDRLICELADVSPGMAEHSRAVSAWSARIARKLGLDEDEIAFLLRCGLVHDVGKILTPSEILNAPRRLSQAEWTVMKNHVNAGEALISDIASLVQFVPVVRGHHERIDGRGYPDGLRSGAIPLAARIVTVADSFNAMIGRRSYQTPRAPTEALEELYRHRHVQFDPEIVEAMAQIVMGSQYQSPQQQNKDEFTRKFA